MPETRSRPNSALAALGFRGVALLLWRYFREKLGEQVRSVWFIIAYLLFFQVVILRLPVVHSVTIALGLAIVVLGLTFFMEGLRLGLMPFGETIGAILPRNSRLPLIMGFAFLLGVGATFAEPAISVLKRAGAGVSPHEAPLLYSLLNDFSGQLVAAVGIGVGVAVTLGILRFFYNWSLKRFILPLVALLSALTVYAASDPLLEPVIGLAWDCGAVTTGPVTVPLVLALGIGVCRIVGNENSGHSGFGIVTLASLFPILAVLLLALAHRAAGDYHGGPNYRGALVAAPPAPEPAAESSVGKSPNELPENLRFSEDEFAEFQITRELPGRQEDFRTLYRGGEAMLQDGRIVLRDVEIVLEKKEYFGVLETFVRQQAERPWDHDLHFGREVFEAMRLAIQAILPLCGFLLLTLLVVLRERLRKGDEIALGVAFSLVGMALFALGLTVGLTPLGTQLGSNIPLAFASIAPWGHSETLPALFDNIAVGKFLAIFFAFFLGYGATLAEPALNALGRTVETVTVGSFRKPLLVQVVAVGVGLGIAAGVAVIAFDSLRLTWMLIPPYLLLLFLTTLSTEEFVNFAWDSAGVTTGPITVPLVLAMGLGLGAGLPGVSDGFGILALASAGPILTVLCVGLIVSRSRRIQREGESDEVS